MSLFAPACLQVFSSLLFWPARAVKVHGVKNPSLVSPVESEQHGFVNFDPRNSTTRVGSCKDFECPHGWVYSVDLTLDGSEPPLSGISKETHMCCEKTCELWPCSHGYVSNPAYYSNVAQNDQQCCDIACGNFTCNANYSQAGTLAPGTTHDECCLPTCAIFDCTAEGTWKTDSSKAGVVAANESSCCFPSCARFNCSDENGWATDTSKLDVAGDKFGDCCLQECRIINCWEKGDNYAVPDERMGWTNGTDACCAKKV